MWGHVAPVHCFSPLHGGSSRSSDGETISNGKTVLVVDDDPVFRRATGIKLHFSGFEVRTATENSEAIAALGREPIDAVIMDIQFPVDACNGGMGSWDGLQIMQWIRGLPGGDGVRFVIVSNSDSAAYRVRAQELGAVAFLRKPLDYEQLVEVLNIATNAHEAKAVPEGQQRAAADATADYYSSLRPSLIH